MKKIFVIFLLISIVLITSYILSKKMEGGENIINESKNIPSNFNASGSLGNALSGT